MFWTQSSDSTCGFISATVLLIIASLALSSYAALNYQLRLNLHVSQESAQLRHKEQAATWSLIHNKAQIRTITKNDLLVRSIAWQKLPLEDATLKLHFHHSNYHPLPRWSKLALRAKAEGCFGTLTKIKLASCLNNTSSNIAFISQSREIGKLDLDSHRPIYLVATGTLSIKQLSLNKSQLNIIAANSIEVAKVLCMENHSPAESNNLGHRTFLYSSGGKISLPEMALGCLNDCRLLAYAAHGVSLGGTRYIQKSECANSVNLEMWTRQKAVGKAFLKSRNNTNPPRR